MSHSRVAIVLFISCYCFGCAHDRCEQVSLLVTPGMVEGYISAFPYHGPSLNKKVTHILRYSVRHDRPVPLPSYAFSGSFDHEYILPRCRISPILLLDVAAVPATLNVIDGHMKDLETWRDRALSVLQKAGMAMSDIQNGMQIPDTTERIFDGDDYDLCRDFQAACGILGAILCLKFDGIWEYEDPGEMTLDDGDNPLVNTPLLMDAVKELERKLAVLVRSRKRDVSNPEVSSLLNNIDGMEFTGYQEAGLIEPTRKDAPSEKAADAFLKLSTEVDAAEVLPELYSRMVSRTGTDAYFVLFTKVMGMVSAYEVYMADEANYGPSVIPPESLRDLQKELLRAEIDRIEYLVTLLRERWFKMSKDE